MATYGQGILKGLGITLKHFVQTYFNDLRYFQRKYVKNTEFELRQGPKSQGIFTVQYPDEKLAVPERFRFTPFLVVEDPDHPERPGHDWCTSCGICAKVCPPQCIWIVRGEDPVTKRPIPEPEAFFIDIDICMNCGLCAEYCPFDAIKMDHDYEMASYDRTSAHIHDKARLSKPFSYWLSIAPTTAHEEAAARGTWEHTDVQKAKKKEGVPAAPFVPVSSAQEIHQLIRETNPKKAAEPAASVPAVAAQEAQDAPVVSEVSEEDKAKAERLAKREAALARKRAAQQQTEG